MTDSTADIPMIWTALGNLPLADLEYEVKWERTETYVKFIEIHRYRGELVREAAHVLALQGIGGKLLAGGQQPSTPPQAHQVN
jgi:hypothetical protein